MAALDPKTVQEITSPIIGRAKAGKAGFVLVTHTSVEPPEYALKDVEQSLEAAQLKVARVTLAELGANPIAGLLARAKEGAQVFLVICDHASIERDDASRVKALNLQRSTFAREKLLAVLWIAEADMPRFGAEAANFLDYRARVVAVEAVVEEKSAIAKVVLLGDSGVGKSGLALRLMGQPFQPTESTHGRQVFLLDEHTADSASGPERRETYLWDLAGQPGYRLVHQLHLHDAAVAVVVFDSRSETDPFAGVHYWAKALSQAQRLRGSLPLHKILVAARADRGGSPVNRQRIEQAVKELGFDAYIETSARSGANVDELRSAIDEALDWNALPKVSSSKLLVSIKDFFIQEKGSGRLLSKADDLYRAFRASDKAPAGDEDLRSAFDSVAARLQSQGLVRRFSFGQLILLQPERLDSYASAIVQSAREEPDGLGTIAEQDALVGRFRIDDDLRLADHEEEKLLLLAVVEDLLQHEIALRETTDSGSMLIFPAQLTRERPDLPDPPGKAAVLSFEGPVPRIYATLSVRLSRSGVFQRKEFFRNAATFTVSPNAGVCGIWLREREEGTAELTLFFETDTAPELRTLFEEFIRTHLERHVIPGTLHRRAVIACPSCGTSYSDVQVEARRSRGFADMRCSVCDTVFSLIEKREVDAGEARQVAAMDRAADRARMKEVAEARIRAKRKTEDFDVFLSYHSSDLKAVQQVAMRLTERGLLPWLDKTELRPGVPFQRELERQIGKIKAAAVFVGKSGMGPWQDLEQEALLRQFVERRCAVIPVILRNVKQQPELPLFLSGMTWVDLRRKSPDPIAELVFGITGDRAALAESLLSYQDDEIIELEQEPPKRLQ